MGQTTKGIVYPSNYKNDANIPVDTQTMAESIDTVLDNYYTEGQVDSKIPTKVSQLTNDSGFVESSDLSSVATSGNYNDLSNKPTIPDVSNFITKDVNNLTYYTLATNTGSTIDLQINSSTYVVTLALKNSSGTTISTGTIDLPLESVVVNGAYNDTTKKIILTLNNGSTIEFSVADLVSGLQTEITSSNKLSADLVDDTNTTNKFVTASDKTNWNAKYEKASGGIPKTDLESSVQTSLGKADTALQQHQDISGLVAKTSFVYDSTTETLTITIN